VCVLSKLVPSARHFGLISNESLAEYLIVITDSERFGGISTNDILHAKEFDIIPLNPDVSVQNPSHPVEAYLLALVKSHLNGGSFFFSHTWDLSRRLQVQWLSEKADAGKAMWEVVRIMCNCLRSIDQMKLVI
jgi:phosphatidylinositol 4-phosphatase